MSKNFFKNWFIYRKDGDKIDPAKAKLYKRSDLRLIPASTGDYGYAAALSVIKNLEHVKASPDSNLSRMTAFPGSVRLIQVFKSATGIDLTVADLDQACNWLSTEGYEGSLRKMLENKLDEILMEAGFEPTKKEEAQKKDQPGESTKPAPEAPTLYAKPTKADF